MLSAKRDESLKTLPVTTGRIKGQAPVPKGRATQQPKGMYTCCALQRCPSGSPVRSRVAVCLSPDALRPRIVRRFRRGGDEGSTPDFEEEEPGGCSGG